MALSLHQANDPALIQAELAIVFSHRNTALAALHLLCELKESTVQTGSMRISGFPRSRE
jgi:hypothetical protein